MPLHPFEMLIISSKIIRRILTGENLPGEALRKCDR